MASNSTDVYIKLNTGKSTLFTVSIYDRVEVLCDLVAKRERVGSRQVMLKYQGKQLDKYKTIQEYGIRIETILVAQILIPHDVTLILDLPNDNKDEMLISSLDSVTTLYMNIATRLWTSTDAVQLYVSQVIVMKRLFPNHGFESSLMAQ
uniref:Ubiquitin-like domain-containing protein n=1 Tax=Biomphalaria glabrata TaxID=6526 RepID=A0A2C9M461_BIOGL